MPARRESRSSLSRWCAPVLIGLVLAGCAGEVEPDVSAFSGQWFQHAGALNIKTNGEVDLLYQLEQPPNPSSFPELKLKIQSVEGDTATAVVTSTSDPQVPVGATFTFRRAEPGIVATTPDGGTALWCDPPHKDLGACGA